MKSIFDERFSDMNILKTILENKELADKINYKCDIAIYPEMRKQEDADGHMTWNIEGMAFGEEYNNVKNEGIPKNS